MYRNSIIQVESELAAVRKRIEERGDAADKAEHFSPYTPTVQIL